MTLTAGQACDHKAVAPTLDGIRIRQRRGRPRRWPKVLVGDKGYSFGPVRRWARKRRIRAVLPHRADQKRPRSKTFDRALYRARNIIERVVGWLKERRRLGTRYEKLAVNYLAMVQLALIEDYLRRLDSADRT